MAQEDDPTTKEPPFSQPPKLEQAFDDDFSKDSRANYEIKGDVKWERGRLSLGNESVLKRKLVNSGPWIEMELNIEFPQLAKDGESSELKIWLDLEDATDSFVLFRQFRAGGKTRSEISIVDSDGNWDADPETEPVRKPLEIDSGLPSGSWRVGYRNGLWLVRRAKVLMHSANITNGDAYPLGLVVLVDKSVCRLQQLRLAKTNRIEAKYTDSEKAKLANASQLEGQLGEHYQRGEFSDALAVALKIAEIRREVGGQFHRDYATSLSDLGMVYMSISNYEKAESLLLEAMQIKEKVLSKEHPDYASNANGLARLNQLMGDYKKAELLYLEALQTREKVLGKEHPDYANNLNNLALLYVSMGVFEKAEPLYIEALQVMKKIHGKEHSDYATNLNNLALLYSSLGDYKKAEPLYLEAMRISKKVLGKEHPEYAICLNNLSSLYTSMGAYEKAKPLCLATIQITEKVLGKEHPSYANGLKNLGRLCELTGAYEEAESLLLDAIQIIKKALGTEHPDYAAIANSLAGLYQAMGAYEYALPRYLEVLQIRERVLGKEHPDYATSLNDLATLYYLTGAYEKAEPLYVSAMQIRKKVVGTEHSDYASSLNNLALLYDDLGAYEKAEPLHLSAMKIRKKVLGIENPDYASSLSNLAAHYTLTGGFEKAEPLYLEALKISEKALGKEHPDYATSLNNLAILYESIGAYEKAELLFLKSIKIVEKALGKESSSHATSLNNLGGLYELAGAYEKAEQFYIAAIKTREKKLGKEHPDYAQTVDNLAGLYELIGTFDKAEPLYRISLSITQSNFERFAIIQTESQQLEYQNNFQSSLSDFLSVTQKLNIDPTYAFELLMNWKGQIQLRQSAYRSIGRDKEITKLFADYRSVSQRLFKHLENDPTTATWKDRLNNLTTEKEAVEKELAAKSAKFAQTKEQITLKQIQDSIPTGAAFATFHRYQYSEHVDKKLVYEDRLLAFVVHATGKVKMINLGESDSIFQAVQDWRTIFDPSQDTLANQKKAELAADLLRKRLWQPVEQHFEKGVTTVLISPDGELGTLPFPALPGKNRDSYLVNEYQIATIPVPRLLVAIAKRKSSGLENPKALLVGDVDYASSVKPTDDATQMVADRWRGMNDVLQGDWPQLAQTGLEVEQIRDLLVLTESTKTDSIQLLKQKQASEFLFRDIAPNFNILHIATHGFFADPKFETIDTTDQIKNEVRLGSSNQQNESAKYYNLRHPGILSGLVFAGANKKNDAPGADDGIMTADEISVLQLKDVDLVTLSACETGLGKSAGGEGLIGIQRAFQISGARTTVASLWKVDDLATRKLMERFYRNMFEKKMGKLAALTEAQRWLLNNPKEHSDIIRGKRKLTTEKSKIASGKVKSLPTRYWAAWILAGDWR